MLSKAVSSFALVALAACAASKPTYIIGAAGPWKQGYGLQNLQGIQLAVEEINKAGGINGHPLTVSRAMTRATDPRRRRSRRISS